MFSNDVYASWEFRHGIDNQIDNKDTSHLKENLSYEDMHFSHIIGLRYINIFLTFLFQFSWSFYHSIFHLFKSLPNRNENICLYISIGPIN